MLPGGLIALAGAWFLRALSQTERGRKVVALAQRRVPSWAQSIGFPAFGRSEAA
ncbi:MAG TPA: hypothetical protein VFE90_03865 [Myxococcales bacterium]|nr:hypothetical protein [Myxococcales bacterium]